MDEEISKLVRSVVRCGPEAIKAAISRLQYQLANTYDDTEDGELPHCRLADHRNNGFHGIDHIFGYANTSVDGDFLRCKSCHRKVASSVQICTCAWRWSIEQAWGSSQAAAGSPDCPLYMIGDRDYLRSRCRNCHGIVGSSAYYPKTDAVSPKIDTIV